ncbi:MAG: hypothetical protein AMXMBFR68_19270 [Ignavibacteria bacterium]
MKKKMQKYCPTAGPTPRPPPQTRTPAPPPGPLPKRARAFREGEGGHVTFYTYDTTNVT